MIAGRELAEIIISLTTISHRIEAVHSTIASLLCQKFDRPYSVVLFISKDPYLLDEGIGELPNSLVEMQKAHHNFSIQWVPNTGPYRKIVPLLSYCFEAEIDPIIVSCDDDVIYPDSFLQSMVEAHLMLNSIVAFRGYTMSINEHGFEQYRVWQASEKRFFSVLNIPTGKDGILYRPHYFDRNVTDERSYKALAPTADDLWLKWHTAKNGIAVALLSVIGFDELPNSKIEDFSISLYDQFNKKGGNDQTIEKLEQHFSSNYGGSIFEVAQYFSKNEPNAISDVNREIRGRIKSGRGSNLNLHNYKIGALLENGIARSGQFQDAKIPKIILQTSKKTHFALTQRQARISSEPKLAVPSFGGMRYVQEAVDRFDNDFGWLSKKFLENRNPLVSVIMTTFNAEKTILWALNSILNQDYKNIEVVVVDDSSDDNTFELVRSLSKNDERVRCYRLPKNRGTYFCKNLGILQSKGEYIAFQDSDDYSHPGRIRLQLWRILSTKSAATRCSYVRHSASDGTLVYVNGAPFSLGYITLLVRRSVFREIGYFDCARKAADDEFIRRLKKYSGDKSIDDFSLPAYVALYERNSLISDSASFENETGLKFSLSADRASYLNEFEKFHSWIFSKESNRIADFFQFPPNEIYILKSDSILSFSEEEIKLIPHEIDAAISTYSHCQAEVNE